MKNASPEQIKQIATGNIDTLVEYMKEAKEHIVLTMISVAVTEDLPQFRAEARALHELISLVESAPLVVKDLADSVTGSASHGDLM